MARNIPRCSAFSLGSVCTQPATGRCGYVEDHGTSAHRARQTRTQATPPRSPSAGGSLEAEEVEIELEKKGG